MLRCYFSDISKSTEDSSFPQCPPRILTLGNPHLGKRTVQGLLRAEGFVIQRERVAESLIRVDATAVAMRWCQSVRRRTYQVPGPNALWHIGGNHKLIRYL